MRKKGFTLIEMLAVLVILAIIALIIIPLVSNVIDSARKAAFKETVNGIIESADNYIGEYVLMHNNDPVYPMTIYCNGTECEDSNGTKLEFKGKVPVSGKVILESAHVVRADLISDGVYCGSGTRGHVEVYSKCSELDHTAPIVDESKLNDIVISTTTNTLTLSIPMDLMYDNETGITGYNIDLYLGNNKVGSKEFEEPNIIFEGLKSDTEYKVVITGINGNRGKTSVDRTATTLDIIKPTISYTNDPTEDINGYFRSQTLNVAYTKGNVENPEYYIRSGRSASTNINVIGICGSDTNPSECSNIDISNIEANTWYKVSGNISVIYDVNANTESSLTAIIYDGTNYVASDTKIVGKIDSEGPSVTTITYNVGGTGAVWQNDVSVTLSATDNVSVSYYEIDYTGDGNANTTTDANFVPSNGWHSGDNRFRAVDHVGNRGPWTASQYYAIDKENPTHTNWWWGEVNNQVARLYIQVTDNLSGVPAGGTYNSSLYNGHNVGVYCPTSTATGGYANWVWFPGIWDAGANAFRCDVTPATFGHYGQTYITHLYIWDYAGNGGYYNQTSVSIPALCSFTSQDFGYTGGVQAWTVPSGCAGTYKLEVWGAQGGGSHISGWWGSASRSGGLGGYASGTLSLSVNETLYIVVGGQGGTGGNLGNNYNGGYNGGGAGSHPDWTSERAGGGGGGATHIGRQNAVLANTSPANVIIVAGGGGGGYMHGGGEEDGRQVNNYATNGSAGGPSSYSGGGAYGRGTGAGTDISQDTINTWNVGIAGGGGGYTGGKYGKQYVSDTDIAYGGTNYIGGVAGGSTIAGQRAGHGYARITKQ